MVEVFEFLPPPLGLQRFVKYIWTLEGKASSHTPYYHKALVDGCSQLLFAYQGGFTPLNSQDHQGPLLKSCLVAQSTTSQTYQLTEDFKVFGVCLYPFTVPYTSGVDGRDFIGRLYASYEMPGKLMSDVDMNIARLDHHDDRLGLLTDLFQPYQRQPEPRVLTVIRQMFHAQGPESITRVLRTSGMSSRHLQRQFKRYTGYTPKQLVRILRMQLTLSEQPDQPLSDIAAQTDYYDQSHLSNEFKSLAGTTPRAYFSGTDSATQWRQEGEEVAFFQSTGQKPLYHSAKLRPENTNGDD